MSATSSSSSTSQSSSRGVHSPAMQLVREPFTVQGGNRDHTVYRSLEKGRPMFFAQHRRSCYEAALFEGRTKIGQVTEDLLELREVRVASDKLYSTPLFSSHRRWKGPDGVKYSWQATSEGDLKLLESKSNILHAFVDRSSSYKSVTLTISSQVAPFIELILLTLLQAEFEVQKKERRRREEEEDKDQELGVW